MTDANVTQIRGSGYEKRIKKPPNLELEGH